MTIEKDYIISALEQERDEALAAKDGWYNTLVECREANKRLRAAIREAIADCPRSDCPDCDGLRRALADTEGERRVDRATEREYREWREQKAEGE